MVKILIYEDDENDLIRRYSSLTAEYDVHVRHPMDATFGPRAYIWSDREGFAKEGFNIDNFKADLGDVDEPADVYFVDGLDGYCFELLSQLPKEKTFLNTDHPDIEREAVGKEYQVLRTTPAESVRKTLEKLVNKQFL